MNNLGVGKVCSLLLIASVFLWYKFKGNTGLCLLIISLYALPVRAGKFW